MPTPGGTRLFHAVKEIWKGVEWRATRAYRQAAQSLYGDGLYWLALLHRRTLGNTLFIGITGSAGKTTTKDLVAAILERHRPHGRKSPGTANSTADLASLVWGARRSDTYCVAEVSILTPGYIDRALALVRPTVGVVTNIGGDHFSAYRSLDGIAREKSKLISFLPARGIAVLNADDARVLAMQSLFPGRTITYGTSATASLKAEDIQASWPDRLSFTVLWNGERVRVQTRLCGSHWVTMVLAALATALASGVPLRLAAEAIATVEPFDGRMSPVESGDGVTFIRDDWKAPLWTIAPTFDFMRQARAARKIIVIGTVSDYPGDSARRYVQIARQALAIADGVVFVGPWASSSLRAKSGPQDNLWGYATLREAATYLSGYLQPGDLVLLKGSTRTDHLERLVLVRTTGVQCWLPACHRACFCNECALVHVPSPGDAGSAAIAAPMAPGRRAIGTNRPPATEPASIVVGMGNPEERYSATPHNVGRNVVDILAQRFERDWVNDENLAMVLRARWDGRWICLMKLLTPMNNAGPVLAQLAQEHGFGVEECILVHDDLDLPIGTVRTRLRGGAGGHRGLQSIVETFQNDRARRVKIGIGRPPPGTPALDYVLRPFAPDDLVIIDAACRSGADRVLELIRQPPPSIPLPARRKIA